MPDLRGVCSCLQEMGQKKLIVTDNDIRRLFDCLCTEEHRLLKHLIVVDIKSAVRQSQLMLPIIS